MLTAKDYEVIDQLKKLPQFNDISTVKECDVPLFVEKYNELRATALHNLVNNYTQMKVEKVYEITEELLKEYRKNFFAIQLGILEKEENESMRFYNVKEAATLLKVSKQTIYKYIKEGRVETIKVGNRFVLSEQAIQKLIESLKIK